MTKLTRIEDRLREVIEEVTLYRALTKADAPSCLIVALPRLTLPGRFSLTTTSGNSRQDAEPDYRWKANIPSFSASATLRTLEPLPSCWPGRCLTVIWNSENITPRPAMPLTRLKNEFLEEDGVRFLMADEVGNTVACIVSHEALRDHT
ncbi:MAG: hypothetical protein WCC81_08140, partial [Pseudolabrys sp.]